MASKRHNDNKKHSFTAMNKHQLITLMAATAIAAAPASAAPKKGLPEVKRSGDTTLLITPNADTVLLVDGNTLTQKLKSTLDDTIYADGGEAGSVQNDNDNEAAINQADNDRFFFSNMVKHVCRMIFTTIFLIVLVVSLFSYLRHRAKYKMIEKAIENNYPLPSSLLGNQPSAPVPPAQPVGGQPVNLWPPQPQAFTQPQSAGRISWQAFKGSVTLVIVGFALVMFFLAVGAPEMAFLCSAILLFGLAKGFFTYQEQRNTTPPQPPVPPAQQPDQQQ